MLNIPGTDSSSQPRTTRRLAFDRTPSTLPPHRLKPQCGGKLPAVQRTVARIVPAGQNLHNPPVIRREHRGLQSLPPHRNHRTAHRTGHRRQPHLGRCHRRLPTVIRLGQDLPDRLTGDHEPLPRGLGG